MITSICVLLAIIYGAFFLLQKLRGKQALYIDRLKSFGVFFMLFLLVVSRIDPYIGKLIEWLSRGNL